MKSISIIIPSYQNSREIAGCLDSIFAQTFTDFEVIVVNDGSTDDTLAVLEQYKDQITLIDQENRGGNAARNRGFEASSAPFLIFSDADLIWKPHAFEKMMQVLGAHPKASYAYSSFRFGWKKFGLWPFNAERLKRMPYIHTSALIRREDFPGFDESLKRLQDWDLWLTMLEEKHEGVWVNEVLFKALPRKGLLPWSGISEWMPRFMHRIPWPRLGFKPAAITRYDEAVQVVKKKHGLA